MRNGTLAEDLTTHFPDEDQSDARNDTGDTEYDNYDDNEDNSYGPIEVDADVVSKNFQNLFSYCQWKNNKKRIICTCDVYIY